MTINVEGFTPYEAQRGWIEKIEDPKIKYACLITARQVGKSLLLSNLGLKWSLENNNVTTMIVSPIYNQVRKIYDDIEKVIAGTPLLVSSNKSNYEMTLINGSKIIFRSAEKPDNLRGYTNDYLLIDEAAFIKESVWDEILKPTVLVKGRKVLFCSTPKQKGTWIHKIYLYGLEKERTEYVSMNATSYDNPFIDKKELDEAKRTMPEHIYLAEVLGQFTEGNGDVFKEVENYCIIDNWTEPMGGNYWAGIDLGRMNDYSVLTILDENGNVVFIYRENKKSWDEIIENMVKHLKRYNATAFVEVNGIGDPLFDQIKKKYRNINPFQTTNQSKQQIIEDLIYRLNTGGMYLPTQELFEPLYNELQTFSYSYSPQSRKIVYKAIEGFHDDCIMSLGIALHSLRSKKNKGVYHLF